MISKERMCLKTAAGGTDQRLGITGNTLIQEFKHLIFSENKSAKISAISGQRLFVVDS